MANNLTNERWGINTSDFLGFKHQTYLSNLYNYAITNPTSYNAMRTSALEKIKFESIGSIYDNFFHILSKGMTADQTQIIFINNTATQPAYPAQKVSELSLKAAQTLEQLLNEVCEIVLPDYTEFTHKRLREKTNGQNIDA
jgi:hypothetical protein